MNNNKKSPINNKILNLTFYLTLLLPFTILTRYFIGYRKIIWFDIALTILLLVLIGIHKFKKEKSGGLYKSILILFLIACLSGIILPGFEYRGVVDTLLAQITYTIPSIIYFLFYRYYYRKGLVLPKD